MGDVNISEALECHKGAGCKATMTAVQPQDDMVRFTENDLVTSFEENQMETALGLMVAFLFLSRLSLIT